MGQTVKQKIKLGKENLSVFATEFSKTAQWLCQKDNHNKFSNLLIAANEVGCFLKSKKLRYALLASTVYVGLGSAGLAFKKSFWVHDFNYLEESFKNNYANPNSYNDMNFLEDAFKVVKNSHKNAPYKKYAIRGIVMADLSIIFLGIGGAIHFRRKEDDKKLPTPTQSSLGVCL